MALPGIELSLSRTCRAAEAVYVFDSAAGDRRRVLSANIVYIDADSQTGNLKIRGVDMVFQEDAHIGHDRSAERAEGEVGKAAGEGERRAPRRGPPRRHP